MHAKQAQPSQRYTILNKKCNDTDHTQLAHGAKKCKTTQDGVSVYARFWMTCRRKV